MTGRTLLSNDEICLVYAGINKKQVAWRLLQLSFVSGYIFYKVHITGNRVTELKQAQAVKER